MGAGAAALCFCREKPRHRGAAQLGGHWEGLLLCGTGHPGFSVGASPWHSSPGAQGLQVRKHQDQNWFPRAAPLHTTSRGDRAAQVPVRTRSGCSYTQRYTATRQSPSLKQQGFISRIRPTASPCMPLGHTQPCASGGCSAALPRSWKGLGIFCVWNGLCAGASFTSSSETASISEPYQPQEPALQNPKRSDHIALQCLVFLGLQPCSVPRNQRGRVPSLSPKQGKPLINRNGIGKNRTCVYFPYFFCCNCSRPVQGKHPSGLIGAATAKENKGNTNHFQ